MSAQTAGPDFEGVLGRHALARPKNEALTWCACLRWSIERGDLASDECAYDAHVAAALRAEVGRWLGSEGAAERMAEAYDSRPAVESSADSMRAALAALAEQVGADN